MTQVSLRIFNNQFLLLLFAQFVPFSYLITHWSCGVILFILDKILTEKRKPYAVLIPKRFSSPRFFLETDVLWICEKEFDTFRNCSVFSVCFTINCESRRLLISTLPQFWLNLQIFKYLNIFEVSWWCLPSMAQKLITKKAATLFD